MLAKYQNIERIQRVIAKITATNPAGVNLLLIGGFRYRLLDQSQRYSVDIDYHWGADLDAVTRVLNDFAVNRDYHAAAIQKVIEEQMDPVVAQQINTGGGGKAVFNAVLELLKKVCPK